MSRVAGALILSLVATLAPAPESFGGESRADTEPPSLWTRQGGSDWGQFLGPTGDGKSSEQGITTEWPEAGLPIVWQRQLGEGYAPPSVAAGRLFIFDRTGDNARLTCVHAETGEQLWQFTYPTDYTDQYGYDGGPRCQPIVDEDRVYILGPDGMLHCLTVADGKPVWKLNVNEKFGVVENFFGVGAAPVIEGDLLIMQVGGSPPGSPPTISGEVKGNGSGIVAFNKRTGEVVYKITDELASYSTPTLATIDGRRWCFVFARGGLVGFNPADGKVDFHYPWRADTVESVNAASPVVIGDLVFISECYDVGSSLLKVRPGGYDVVWKDAERGRPNMATHWNTPIHIDGYLYGSSGRHSGGAELRCIEVKTGKIMWSVPRLTRSQLTYIAGHFIVLTEFGQLFLIRPNAAKFEPVAAWLPVDDAGKELLEYPAWAAPVVSYGLMYVRGKDRLLCVELRKN